MPKDLHLYDVIVRPVVTEKSSIEQDEHNQYTFEVALDSNKVQIKEAVEIIFDVDVLKVNTLVMPAKRARRGRRTYVRKKMWKKAVITIAPGQSIDLYGA